MLHRSSRVPSQATPDRSTVASGDIMKTTPLRWPPDSLRRRATYEVRGNVIWVRIPTRRHQPTRPNALLTLVQSVARLGSELERSRRLQSEIAEASVARRYEMFKFRSAQRQTPDWALAAAERAHLNGLLRFVHAFARGQSRSEAQRELQGESQGESQGEAQRETQGELPASREALARSLRELRLSVERAKELTRSLRSAADPRAE